MQNLSKTIAIMTGDTGDTPVRVNVDQAPVNE